MSGGVLEEGEEFWVPLGIPAEFPYEFGPPDSPAESVLGSTTETESDEDELIHLLTRSTLQDTTHSPPSLFKPENDRVTASSPKSTLSRPRTWPYQATVTGPVFIDNSGWGALFFPSDGSLQASRAKTSSEVPPEPDYPRGRGLPCPHHSTNQLHLPPQKIPCSGFSPRQLEEMVNYQAKLKSRWIFEDSRQQVIGMLPQSAWPNLRAEHNNKLNGGGLKPIFLSGVKRERTGTGVFLPRRFDTHKSNHTVAAAGNPRKKTSCSTVLMPTEVMQSLNMNFEDIGVVRPQSCYYNYNVDIAPNYDVYMARRNAILAQQRPSLRVDGVNHEVHLPQDWTY